MKKVVLFIDTTQQNVIVAAIEQDGKRVEKKFASKSANAQNILPLIEKLLQICDLKLADIREIQASPGPGSFTGVRVGLSVANMLGKLLSIPVNGKVIGETILPIYTPSRLDSGGKI